jgi:signal transduction histidine kinase
MHPDDCNPAPYGHFPCVKWDLPRRLAVFASAILAVSALLGWRAWVAWSETGRLAALGPALDAGLDLAEHYKAGVLEMNHALARYGITGRADERTRFMQLRSSLRQWIDARAEESRSESDRIVLGRIQEAFRTFETDADDILAAHALPGTRLEPVQLIDRLESGSRALLEFATELDHSHRSVLNRYLADAEESVGTLHNFTIGSLITLLILIGCLGAFVWHDLIAPLQNRLRESRIALERREKLASLGVLAAGVAHEIRNPLTSIKARAYTLSRCLQPGSDEHDDASVIGGEISRLEKIVDDFLRFSRPGDPCPRLVQAGTVFRDLMNLLEPEIAKHNVRIGIGSLDDTRFPADPEQLKQVLINLVRNSLEASPPGSTVTLSSQSSQMRIERRNVPVMELAVTDTGPGISEEVQRRLFDPFFTTKPSGTGLGLSIGARIVEGHGGTLSYRTHPGHGTTFTIHLPLVAQASDSRSATQPLSTPAAAL